MRILIVGADGRGSFEVRGRQMGHAIGARVTTSPSARDWSWADVIVLIKRAAFEWGDQAKRAGAPIVWDALDFWKQPAHNQDTIAELTARAWEVISALGVVTVIGATESMAKALEGVCLPHHSRPGLEPAVPRLHPGHHVVVGYEGCAKYLGSWRAHLETACAELGMTFVVNPPDLRELDVVVAFRGESHDGEVCREWKSGVKYVNALAAGRPVLTQTTAAFDEINPDGLIVTKPEDLHERLLSASSATMRVMAYKTGLRRAKEFSLDAITRRFRGILDETVRSAA